MRVNPQATDHEAKAGAPSSATRGIEATWWTGTLEATKPDLMQAAAGPERHCSLIHKLAVMK